ncbi:MAG: YeiH family putative sulfate export transporter [Negativicutes bacterium]|nr:YeiH family putative sulfate export transporter [Negativicutes bacterium]
MIKLEKLVPGIVLCFVLGVPAWIMGNMFPIVGSPVIGIIIGMLATWFFPELLSNQTMKSANSSIIFEEGIKYTSKKILQNSIILLGFSMNLFHVLKVGTESLSIIVCTLTASFLTAYFIGKMLGLDGKMTTLIGVGTSVCGGSAIAATAPVIKAKDSEVAHAISTIFLFNIVAVFIFPVIGASLGLSDIGFGMWAGTAINDTSSVVAAGAAWSNMAGNDKALAYATIVKLTRTLMIVPITLVLAIYTARSTRTKHEAEKSFNIASVFPWFVLWFLVTALLNTFLELGEVSDIFVVIGKYMIVMAMVAIGLNTDLKKLIANGLKPIFLGICCWVAVAIASLLVQRSIGIW